MAADVSNQNKKASSGSILIMFVSKYMFSGVVLQCLMVLTKLEVMLTMHVDLGAGNMPDG